MSFEKLKKYSPLLLRTGIAIIFLWFGFSQLKSPSDWVRMLPDFLQSQGNNFIYINGIFEVVFAVFLLLGIYTRFVSLILGLHLFSIVGIVGYGPTGARDFALALATLAIFLNGEDDFCLSKVLRKKKSERV